jgi:hypothetical protein
MFIRCKIMEFDLNFQREIFLIVELMKELENRGLNVAYHF